MKRHTSRVDDLKWAQPVHQERSQRTLERLLDAAEAEIRDKGYADASVVEIARRAFKKLKRPEIFILFYMCSAMMATGGRGLLWRQFLVQSVELRKLGISDIKGLASQVPNVLINEFTGSSTTVAAVYPRSRPE